MGRWFLSQFRKAHHSKRMNAVDKNHSRWRLKRLHKHVVRQPFLVLVVFVILCADSLFAQTAKRTPDQTPAIAESPGTTSSTQAGKSVTQQVPNEKSPGPPIRRILGPGEAPQPFPESKAIAQPKNNEELAVAIKRLADELVKSARFSGSIFLAADGKTLVDGGWGEADRKSKTVNTTDTAFDVGSIGKLFTQIAVLQLTEIGKLGLDEPIGKYLATYPDSEVAGKVTTRPLLLHKSGIPDFFSHVTPETKLESIIELKDFLPLFVHKPLDFEPGSAQRYSSSGYILLGLLIEAVSGENYYTYVQRRILEAAGMAHSGFFDRAHLPPFVAHSYEDANDVTGMHPRRGSPAGGLQASAGDLFRLVAAINTGKLIKQESVKVLRGMIPRPPDEPPPADATKLMGYGIEGGAPGVNAQLVIDPVGRYTRIVLCNGGPPMAMSMGATIREWIKGMPK